MKRIISGLVFFTLCYVAFAQDTTNTYQIGLILPFQAESSLSKIQNFDETNDVVVRNRIRLDHDAELSLSYYQGTLLAMNEISDIKTNLHVYDCYGSDSVLSSLLKNPELKTLDVIIGPESTTGARILAEYSKKNAIVNIQPFSPSKSVTSDNPYHLKISPSIESHIDGLFNSVVDSFPGSNIIIYTPANDKYVSLAKRFDSLFRSYNKTATKKFTISLLNTKDMTVDGKKTTASALLRAGKTNIWIITSFDEAFVNGNMRVLNDERKGFDIILYGMPTWINGDVIRLDYLNSYRTRISDDFYVDSSNISATNFAYNYASTYSIPPDRNAYLGYDVTRFLLQALKDFGKYFLSEITTQRFKGAGYVFDIARNESIRTAPKTPSSDSVFVAPTTVLNYYENKHVNVLHIDDYRLTK